MNIDNYLKRINYLGSKDADEATLIKLHEQHVMNVPFENLDVYLGLLFDLNLENIYTKVVENYRGGFCYELNALFCQLLCNLGFKARIIAARIFDDQDNIGPAMDHMSIFIETDKQYLADVGYGDLFIRPLEINEGIQSDGRNYFKIEAINENEYLLSMSSDQINFQRKYTFCLVKVKVEDFHSICFDKQTNPSSYFVKNAICTKPTDNGRMTIFNNKIIEKQGQDRIEKMISDESELKLELKTIFGIVI